MSVDATASTYLASNIANDAGERVLLRAPVLVPGCEVAKLTLTLNPVAPIRSRSCHRWPSTSWAG